MKKTFVMGIALAAIATSAHAEAPTDPFGFRFGSPITDYNCRPLELEGNVPRYRCESPRKHTDFDGYQVSATNGVGICMVSAHANPSSSFELISLVDKIRRQLERRFSINFSPVHRETGESLQFVAEDRQFAINISWLDKSSSWTLATYFISSNFPDCVREADEAGAGAF